MRSSTICIDLRSMANRQADSTTGNADRKEVSMPEYPEMEHYRKLLAERIAGQPITKSYS